MVYSLKGIVYKNEKLQLQATTWVISHRYNEQKKPDAKEYILYDSIYIYKVQEYFWGEKSSD